MVMPNSFEDWRGSPVYQNYQEQQEWNASKALEQEALRQYGQETGQLPEDYESVIGNWINEAWAGFKDARAQALEQGGVLRSATYEPTFAETPNPQAWGGVQLDPLPFVADPFSGEHGAVATTPSDLPYDPFSPGGAGAELSTQVTDVPEKTDLGIYSDEMTDAVKPKSPVASDVGSDFLGAPRGVLYDGVEDGQFFIPIGDEGKGYLGYVYENRNDATRGDFYYSSENDQIELKKYNQDASRPYGSWEPGKQVIEKGVNAVTGHERNVVVTWAVGLAESKYEFRLDANTAIELKSRGVTDAEIDFYERTGNFPYTVDPDLVDIWGKHQVDFDELDEGQYYDPGTVSNYTSDPRYTESEKILEGSDFAEHVTDLATEEGSSEVAEAEEFEEPKEVAEVEEKELPEDADNIPEEIEEIPEDEAREEEEEEKKMGGEKEE